MNKEVKGKLYEYTLSLTQHTKARNLEILKLRLASPKNLTMKDLNTLIEVIEKHLT